MAMNLKGSFDKIAGFEFKGIPIGKSLLILSAIGIGKGVTDIVYSRWPSAAKYSGLMAGGGMAYLVENVGAVKNFLGDTGADALAVGGVSAAVLSFYDIQGRIEGWLAEKGAGAGAGAGEEAGEEAGGATVPTPPYTIAGAETGSSGVYESDVARRLSAIRSAQISRT